tara:strand:+ start:423 stop:623 length:201 start_codon:yes stop_codon:yes gene_type:complete
MANDGQWKALLASKQLEIDKLKRLLKDKENQLEQKRIDEGGWVSGLGDTKNRKKNKRSKQSDSSDK